MLKQFATLVTFFLLSFSLLAQDASKEMVDPAELGGQILATYPINWQYAPEAVLYDNGPVVNSPGGGPGGADGSILQTSLGLNVLGFGHAQSSNFRVADDFIIPSGQTWTINEAKFYAYQTGSSTTSTITGVNVRIWDGPPGVGNVVFGDTATNRMSATTWSNAYRYSDTNPGTTRPIMEQTVTIGVTLGAGQYWIDWQCSGSLTSGPWAPPITITGQATTGDALQYSGSAFTWSPLIDNGTAQTPQGLPFILDGVMGSMQMKS